MSLTSGGKERSPRHLSEALAAQLDSGQLLTWEGKGHTTYGRAGKCVTGAVDTYLLTEKMPQEELHTLKYSVNQICIQDSLKKLLDYAGAGAMLLQAMTGNIARPGRAIFLSPW